MSTLEIRGVRHRYAGAAADTLHDVSIAVGDGQMVSVIGPSGSGKSTVLRVAAGLETARAGQVLVDGVDMDGRPTERRDLTMMFQAPLLFDHLDVAGNVAFAPRLSGATRREARLCAERYLRLVDLEGMGGRRVGSLSGGQQQRVALARALAAERGALLLDEPFSSLDRELRTSMHDLLDEVRAAIEPTILLVTHDLDEAALADSSVVLIDGRVHQQAPMSEIYRRPATLATARLVGGFGEVHGVVSNGVHRSAWGAIPVADGCPATGAAVLLLRRETVTLGEPDDGSAGIQARVTRRRAAGTREIVTATGEDGSDVELELDMGSGLVVGSPVTLRLHDERTPAWALSVHVEVGNDREVPRPPSRQDDPLHRPAL